MRAAQVLGLVAVLLGAGALKLAFCLSFLRPQAMPAAARAV